MARAGVSLLAAVLCLGGALCNLNGFYSHVRHPSPSSAVSRAYLHVAEIPELQVAPHVHYHHYSPTSHAAPIPLPHSHTVPLPHSHASPVSPTHSHTAPLPSAYTPARASKPGLHELYGWSQLDFAFPSQQTRTNAIQSGSFDPRAVVPIGVAAAGSRLFISLPRWRTGVPAVLATVPLHASNSSSPPLQPYPAWSWHRQGDCEGITSTYRVKVDECNRLWVIDTGAVNTWENPQQICPPQIHVFDLATDQRILRYRFPKTALKTDSLLVSLEVEYPDAPCGGAAGPAGATVYVADVTTFALIVADLGSGDAYRVQDKTMYPTPEAGTFTVAGESFELMDGIIGLALSPVHTQPERRLYFHAMAGYRQRWVATSVLRNRTAANDNPRAYRSGQQPRSSQVAGCGMDQRGVLFLGMLTSNSLACWDTRKPFVKRNLVTLARDDKAMQFITHTTVDPSSRVWALSTRLQSYVLDTLNPREVNYRVLLAPSSSALVHGTACDPALPHVVSSSLETNQLRGQP